MAIDDGTSYELTGAQVKDLASKVKASDPLIIYTSAAIGYAFQTYSDDNLTVVITGAQIGAAFKAGRQIILTTDTILDPIATIVAFTEGPEDMFTCVVDNTTYRYGYKSAQSRWVAVSRTVNDGTLTIQHNGTDVQTFTANQSTNVTANVETIYADPIQATSAIEPLVQTDMIADGAVTGDKIDWNDVATHYSDNSGARQSTAYADGTLISTYIVPITNFAVSTAWGNMYRGAVAWDCTLAPTASPDFVAKPAVTAMYYSSDAMSAWMGTFSAGGIGKTGAGRWAALSGCFQLFRPTSGTISGEIHITAIGRWK